MRKNDVPLKLSFITYNPPKKPLNNLYQLIPFLRHEKNLVSTPPQIAAFGDGPLHFVLDALQTLRGAWQPVGFRDVRLAGP